MARLLVVQGLDLGRSFELAGPVAVLGRGTGIAIMLNDSRVSRKHAEIHSTSSGLLIRDLDSGNGTQVNGIAVRETHLQPGDRITIGDSVLLLEGTASSIVRISNTGSSRPAEPTRIVVRQAEAASAVLRTVPADVGVEILARPDLASTEWLRSRLANLTVLYEATNAISQILDVDELLDRILELVLRTTEADSGCALVLDPESDELMPKAVRSRAARGPAEFVVSRTVVDHVFRERVGLLVSDASADERFRGGESIARHQIREMICVPMTGRHSVVGVLFLDTHASAAQATPTGQPIKFSEDHLRLAVAIGHQAALAIEETRYYQAMLQSERLAAVGQTIAALSHHIKNIMQGVRFGSDMVRMGISGKDDELLTKGWRLVEKNQNKIDDLILDMLSYSKEREPLIEETALPAIVNEVLDVVRGRAEERDVQLIWQEPEAFPLVPCDPEGIHRALLNIIGNGIDAMLDCDERQLQIELRTNAETDCAEIAITDTGPGIPEEKLHEIFKPFVSTKGARGTGLGLPVSRKTLREHGGDVIAENLPNRGARFTLTLPLKRHDS